MSDTDENTEATRLHFNHTNAVSKDGSLQQNGHTNHQTTNHQTTNHQTTNHQTTNHQTTKHQITNHQTTITKNINNIILTLPSSDTASGLVSVPYLDIRELLADSTQKRIAVSTLKTIVPVPEGSRYVLVNAEALQTLLHQANLAAQHPIVTPLAPGTMEELPSVLLDDDDVREIPSPSRSDSSAYHSAPQTQLLDDGEISTDEAKSGSSSSAAERGLSPSKRRCSTIESTAKRSRKYGSDGTE